MIYIQSDAERTRPHHFDAASAMFGAIDTGQNYRLTSYEEVISGKFDSLLKQHLFVGSTEFMRQVFKRMGKTNVKLPLNSNRKETIITLADAKLIAASGRKIFIKPVEIKLFTGFVLDQMVYSSIENLNPETKVISCEPFKYNIVSEWRVYVFRHEIADSKHYSGNYEITPAYGHVDMIINKNRVKQFPVAYTIDMGILENGENVVIEYNDMWAIGNYGLDNEIYLRMLKARYNEICQ